MQGEVQDMIGWRKRNLPNFFTHLVTTPHPPNSPPRPIHPPPLTETNPNQSKIQNQLSAAQTEISHALHFNALAPACAKIQNAGQLANGLMTIRTLRIFEFSGEPGSNTSIGLAFENWEVSVMGWRVASELEGGVRVEDVSPRRHDRGHLHDVGLIRSWEWMRLMDEPCFVYL
ncbi:hypothetical protein BCR34DRAFT_316817 [Clohesyomyces aquaticus]|uniref:Uncharacterized protein n=1 Tax=Clohesyomyces aquaticus TaxID=1231657 RepID=A0A1Y1ZNB5_9PLEO|nr:hypothetical protein BCR34DRAFT_316817 [Clohesyomyces aquaticus]